MFFTPEFLAEAKSLNKELKGIDHRARYGNLEEGDEARVVVIAARLEFLENLKKFDQIMKNVVEYKELFYTIKPTLVAESRKLADELLASMLEIFVDLEKTQEVRAVVAKSAFANYQAYRDAGFDENQAFSLALNQNQALVNSVQTKLLEAIRQMKLA